MDRPRLRVDFNEMVEDDLVLLSKFDVKQNSEGEELLLSEGVKVHVFDHDTDDNDEVDNLLADGVVERNDPNVKGSWTKAAKWCCRIDSKGIYHESTLQK